MKKSVLFTVILLIVLFACVLAGCTPSGGKVIENPDSILNGVIQISLSEYKTTYWLGEKLDLSNAVLKVLLDTGEIRQLDPKNSKTVSVSGYDRFRQGAQTVTIQYGGKHTSTFEVFVEIPKINSIGLKSFPNKTDYIIGDRLDMTGAIITVFMENGTDVDIVVDNSIVTGTSARLDVNKEFTNTGERLELNIGYGSKTIPFYVNVAAATLTAVEIVEWPTKTSYYLGETKFDPAGLKLNYTYNNGKTETVNAESQSNLRYVFDFSVSNNQSPVKVQYVEEDEVLFEAGFTVIVNNKRYVSLRVIQRPNGSDMLIEGFSEIDLSTGRVEVTFDDNSTLELSMDDESISISKYDNLFIGQQTISVYYMNNVNNCGTFSVITNAKSAESVTLSGVEEIKEVEYFEAQAAKISIARLYYTVLYNNGTTGERFPVSESMLAEGCNLDCVSDRGSHGIKTLRFLIEDISVEFQINIIPKAVVKVEIETLPTNTYIVAGGQPNPSGGVIRATYNNGTNEKIDMTDARIRLHFKTDAIAGENIVVKVYVDEISDTAPFDEYTVRVIDRKAESVALEREPSKVTGYKYGDAIDFSGLILSVAFGDGTTSKLRATGSIVVDGKSFVSFETDRQSSESVAVSVLLNDTPNVLSQSADVYVYYYGVRADRAFRITVEERTINGISVTNTDNVAIEMPVGQDYDSVAGLIVKVTYTDRSSDTLNFTEDTAKRITRDTEITEEGYYWYTEGSIFEIGTLTVTVLYAFRNQSGVIATYPCSYSVYYRAAQFRYIQGIYVSEGDGGSSYVQVDTLGSQPKGLTPYLNNYFIGCYYDNDTVEYVALNVAMTDYNVRNLTIGKRPVVITYAGTNFETTIEVTDETVRSVTIGKEPRKNYVFTESLSLVGGTLIRTFQTDGAEKKDTVDMSEANVNLLTRWPTSTADFNGAQKITVTVELRYENVAPVTFTVDVYQPIDLNPTIVNTQNYYGNVSNPSVVLGDPLDGFTLPRYTVRYATDFDGNNLIAGTPTLDANGNTVYPSPKTVGTFYVVVTSEGNRYYNLPKKVEEFVISPLSITLKPNYVTKNYGTEDPEFTYTASNDALWREAMYDENGEPMWSGKFMRERGEDVGSYNITANPDNPFTHPYFTISIEEEGQLNVLPAIVKLELTPLRLYYKKDASGNAIDQKTSIDFRFAFVRVALDGTETVVTEDEIEANQGNPEYAVYEKYVDELRRGTKFYHFSVAVKDGNGGYDETLPVAAIGDYSLRITLSVAPSQKQNFLLYNPDNPSVGNIYADATISVVAEPFPAPSFGTHTLRLETDVTDLSELETLVAAKEKENSTSYDLVATNGYVYIWKYRNTAAQRELFPEGTYLAYNTALSGVQWLTEENGNMGGGFRISKNHLTFDENGAFIRLKFVGNGDDRAESYEVSTLLPIVCK